MKETVKNWTLWPWWGLAAASSAALSLGLGYRGPALAGMLVVFFLASLAALAVLYLLFLGFFALFVDRKKPQKTYVPFYGGIVTYVEGLAPAFFRVRIHAEGLEKLPAGRFLLVSNHRSGFDPLITGWTLRDRRLAFIMKPAILRLPIVGAFIHKACFLSIDRENDRAALKTILEAIRLIREDVVSIGVYPEGTRNKGKELLPFRNGAFKIAQKAGVPIVVAAVRNTERITKNFPWRSTDVSLEFLQVIDAGRLAEMNTTEIGEEVRKCITAFAGC